MSHVDNFGWEKDRSKVKINWTCDVPKKTSQSKLFEINQIKNIYPTKWAQLCIAQIAFSNLKCSFTMPFQVGKKFVKMLNSIFLVYIHPVLREILDSVFFIEYLEDLKTKSRDSVLFILIQFFDCHFHRSVIVYDNE